MVNARHLDGLFADPMELLDFFHSQAKTTVDTAPGADGGGAPPAGQASAANDPSIQFDDRSLKISNSMTYTVETCVKKCVFLHKSHIFLKH